jgi:hypothetical protein
MPVGAKRIGVHIIPPPKVDNAHAGWKAKVEIRQLVLAALEPDRTSVFDAFAGAGLMFSEVWRHAARYVGCDEQWHRDDRCCFVADNRRVMRCIDLAPFNCFDLDAYGSPWEQAVILATRRPRLKPGERIGLVITEGSHLRTMFSFVPMAMRQAAGIAPSGQLGAGRRHDELIARALQGVVTKMGGRIARQWKAVGVTGAKMRYLGVIVEAG